jgi:peroxiredoxin Q/BCP
VTAESYGTELKEGDLAPDFTLPAGDGRQISLRDFRGKNVVLYFYPKDDTPGCTKEACSFRDTSDELAALEAVVLGISPDSVSSHQHFATKYNIPFPLLADVEHRVASSYGVWVEKHAYGHG